MNINGFFAHTLTDLIRGIRQNKKNEQSYIAKEIADIRIELKRNDPDLKAQAIAKLTYLQMMGYDMSWASFHVVEVMSSPKYVYKGIGYLGAVQSFTQETDVLMLTTNLIKKDLASSNTGEISIAINGLSHILTPDLARDLCADLVAMLNHSRPVIRKKVILVLYKVFLKYPEGLRLSFSRMKDRLDDPDPSVVSATVNVICELARRNPKNYLSLAPQLFKLLTNSSNNWMLIKIIKLFAALTPLEPRLTKKLLPPITTLIQTTPAMSLLYECIHTVIAGGMLATTGSASSVESANNLAATCVTKLMTFLEDSDQNLKYIGLLALTKILPSHPHLVANHKDVILKCLDDYDISIRTRALDLIVGMANKRNLTEIVKRLISHLIPITTNLNEADESDASALSSLLDPAYRADIIARIISICSQNSYANITNFEWYLAVLVDLTSIGGVSVGEILMQQFMDVGVRVKSVRSYAVQLMMRLLADESLLESATSEHSNSLVLLAAAWLTGEYCALLENPVEALELLSQSSATKLPFAVQATYLQSMLKVFAFWMNSLQYSWDEEARLELVDMVQTLGNTVRSQYCASSDLEVQERACNVSEILAIVAANVPSTPLRIENSISFAPTLPTPPSILSKLYPLFFQQELNPVAPKAQKKVPVPEGLDLEAWIHEPVPEPESESSDDDFLKETDGSYGYGWSGDAAPAGKSRKGKGKTGKGRSSVDDSAEAKAKRKAERKELQKHDPFYIRSSASTSSGSKRAEAEELDVDAIPIVQLNIDEFKKKIVIKKDKSGKKKSKRRTRSPSPPAIPFEFATEEMPEDATLSASDTEDTKVKSSTTNRGILDFDSSALHQVDLSIPMGEDEQLPRAKPYLKPEELRRQEDELAQQRRVDAANAKKAKKDKSETKKKSSKKEGGEKKSKKSKAEEVLVETLQEPVAAFSPPPVMASPAKTEEKEKKKKSKKAAKETSASGSVKTKKVAKPVIVTFPPRTDQDLVEDEDMRVTYSLALSPSSIEHPVTAGAEATIEPLVSIVFTLGNRNVTKELTAIQLVLTESFDVRLGGAHEGQDRISLNDTLGSNGSLDIPFELLIHGRVRYELGVMGTIHYELEGHEQTLEFNIALVPSTFMLEIPRITGAEFSTLLTEHTEHFVATGAITLPLRGITDGKDDMFFDIVETITKKITHTHVVEIVDGAASLFGQSWQGFQIAGLIKAVKGQQQEDGVSGFGAIDIEMKCQDQSFVDGLVSELREKTLM